MAMQYGAILKNGVNYSGGSGSGGTTLETKTLTEWSAMSDAEKEGKLFKVTDVPQGLSLAQVNEKVTELNQNLGIFDLLWTNPSRLSNLSSVAITVDDISKYDALMILSTAHGGQYTDVLVSSFVIIKDYESGKTLVYNGSNTWDGNVYRRTLTISDNVINIGNGAYSNSNNNPGLLIPYKVYGVKF